MAAGKESSSEEGLPERTIQATVVELLPNAMCLLKLADQSQVRAHAGDARVKNFVRMRPGDRVLVQISPHDHTRGRILRLLSE